MRTATRLLLPVLIATFAAAACRAQPADEEDSGGPLPPKQAAYDVTFYDLDLAIHPGEERIAGSLTARADVVHPTSWFVQDLDERLSVESVALLTDEGAKALPFERRGGQIWTDLERTRQPGERLAVRVRYGGTPREAPRPPWDGGFTWTETPGGEPWIASSVQVNGADLWWPTKDHPSDEPDSMALSFTVPRPLVAASNGRLRRVEDNGEARTYHWFVSTPINNYGVALNVAPYRTVDTTYASTSGTDIPVTFWVVPAHYQQAKKRLPQFLDHLRFYEETLGPYPFRADKYGIAETPHLGMEHQTIIAYGSDFSNNEFGFDYLHHHELGHEWWGNLVTAADWSDFWLHEGFCTYMQALYAEELGGREAYHSYLQGSRGGINNEQPVAPRGSRSTLEMYYLPSGEGDGDIYSKGAWILHSLRHLVGDEAFFEALRRMANPRPELRRATDGRQCRFATTDDFLRIAEAASGRELDWFFEVYLRQPALPRLVTERNGDELRLRWDAPEELSFPMPVPVRVGGETRRVKMKGGEGRLALPNADAEVQVDRKNWILKANGG